MRSDNGANVREHKSLVGKEERLAGLGIVMLLRFPFCTTSFSRQVSYRGTQETFMLLAESNMCPRPMDVPDH